MSDESQVFLYSQLKRLEIDPISLSVKSSIKENPFVNQYPTSEPQQITQEELFGPTCNCSSKQNAQGSAVVNFSQGHRHQFNKNNKNMLFLEKNIRNAIQFKQKGKADKRSKILKASKFLEDVGKCIHNRQLSSYKEDGPGKIAKLFPCF